MAQGTCARYAARDGTGADAEAAPYSGEGARAGARADAACVVLNPIAYNDAQTGERTRAARGANVRLTADQLASGHKFGLVQPFDGRDRKQQQIASTFSATTPEWHHCRDILTGERCGPIIQDLPSRAPKSSTFDPGEMFEPHPARISKAPTAEQLAGF